MFHNLTKDMEPLGAESELRTRGWGGGGWWLLCVLSVPHALLAQECPQYVVWTMGWVLVIVGKTRCSRGWLPKGMCSSSSCKEMHMWRPTLDVGILSSEKRK